MVSKLPAFFAAYPDMAVEMAASESPNAASVLGVLRGRNGEHGKELIIAGMVTSGIRSPEAGTIGAVRTSYPCVNGCPDSYTPGQAKACPTSGRNEVVERISLSTGGGDDSKETADASALHPPRVVCVR